MKARGLGLIAATLLAGCQTPPPAVPRPDVVAPSAFNEWPNTPAEPVAQFWRAFGDAQLDAFVSQAVAANNDLRVAAARVAEAQALAAASQSLGRPTLDLSGGAGRSRTPGNDGGARSANQLVLGASSSWEIDLFGRIRSEQSAAAANLQANQALLRAAQVSVAAEVARSYFELRGLQEQLRVTRLDLQTQRQALALVQARLDAGRGTALDTERARALVETTAASVPALDAALARSRLRLAVLCGQAPGALDTALAEQKPLPGLPATPLAAIGSPQTLLQRRPDVAAAEQQLLAAVAQTGVARSRLYPQLTLQGSLGLNASRIGSLLDSGSFVYNLGASLLWSAIDHGQRRAQLGAADARRDAALAQFDQAVLLALEEAEGALASFTRAQQRSEHAMRAAEAAEKAARIARVRFEAGSTDFLVLLDAERESLRARDQLAQSQTQAATSLVAVYRALAGGWQ